MNRNTTATILIVLAIGIYFTVTDRMLNSAKSVKAVDDQYTSAIANAEKLISLRDKVTKDYNNLSAADKDKLDKMIPSSVDNIRLIIDMNNIASRDGLALSGIHASAPNTKNASTNNAAGTIVTGSPVSGGPVISAPSLDTVTVNFSVTATYQQFLQFMQDLESNLRIMDVTHLTLSANDSGNYTYSVELKTYWLRSQ